MKNYHQEKHVPSIMSENANFLPMLTNICSSKKNLLVLGLRPQHNQSLNEKERFGDEK